MSEGFPSRQNTFTEPRYSPTAQCLHWASAVLMFLIVPIAWYMLSLAKDDPARADWHTIHKSIGLLILLLSAGRLLWRRFVPPPPLAAEHAWEKIAAEGTHILLYLVLFIMPISGYIGSAANGRPVPFFNLFEVPVLVPLDKSLAHFAHEVHEIGQWAVFLLVAGHVAAALFHAVIRKDGTLRRMLPAWLIR